MQQEKIKENSILHKIGDAFRKGKLVKFFPLIMLIASVLLFYVLSNGKLLSKSSLKAIFNAAFFTMLTACGFIFPLTQGNLDLSISGMVAVICAVAVRFAKINPYLAIPASLITGLILGSVNGYLYVGLHIDAFIATVAMKFVLLGVVVIILDYTSFSAPLVMLNWDTMPLKITVLLICLVGMGLLYSSTVFGKQVKVAGCNPETAKQSGVNLKLVRFLPFVICGGMCGIVSFFYLVHTGTASNQTGASLFVDVLNAVLLGGLPISGGASSKFRAVILGSLTSAVLSVGMTMLGVDTFTRQMINGLLFLVIVAISFDRRSLAIIK